MGAHGGGEVGVKDVGCSCCSGSREFRKKGCERAVRPSGDAPGEQIEVASRSSPNSQTSSCDRLVSPKGTRKRTVYKLETTAQGIPNKLPPPSSSLAHANLRTTSANNAISTTKITLSIHNGAPPSIPLTAPCAPSLGTSTTLCGSGNCCNTGICGGAPIPSSLPPPRWILGC